MVNVSQIYILKSKGTYFWVRWFGWHFFFHLELVASFLNHLVIFYLKKVGIRMKVLSRKCCEEAVVSSMVFAPNYLICYGQIGKKGESAKISLSSLSLLSAAGAVWRLDGS